MIKVNVKTLHDTLNKTKAEYTVIRKKVQLGRANEYLDKGKLEVEFAKLDKQFEELDGIIPTGNETQILEISANCSKLIKELNKLLDGEYLRKIVSKTDELSFQLSNWADVLTNSDTILDLTDPAGQDSKQVAKIKERLDLIRDINEKFISLRNQKERQIRDLEASIDELKEKIADPEEENERLITQYYNKYNGYVSQLNDLEVYSERFNDCTTLLERIINNVEYMLETSTENSRFFALAKVFTRIEDFANMANEPEKASQIIRKIDEEVNKLRKSIVPNAVAQELSKATSDALAFRQKLMAEKSAKKVVASKKDLDDIEVEKKDSVAIKAEK